MPVKQLTVRDVEEIVDRKITEAIGRKLIELARRSRDAGLTLGGKPQSAGTPGRPDGHVTLDIIKNSFDDMDFVRQVHYANKGDALRLVIIHDHTPSASAFSAVCSRVLDIEDSLDDADIGTLILHESDVLPHHLRGAKLLFQRPQKSTDAAGPPDGKTQYVAPASLDDPETLDIIKNSFDGMDFVRQVHYRYDEDGFMLIIVHDSEHLGSADTAICNRIVKIEDSLHNAFLRNWILHESEDASLYLDGAKLLFRR